MNIMLVEDEGLLLDALELAVRTAEPEAKIAVFGDAEEALACTDPYETDIAFLDIKLPGISGIEAARTLEELNPALNVIFVTSYSGYMGDAFDLHASGYITKPVTAEKVSRELACLRHPPRSLLAASPGEVVPAERKVVVRCFGNFEVYVDGRPLPCRSERALEMFAYLVDRRGARCSLGEIRSTLWEWHPQTESSKSHLRNLITILNRTFREAGFDDIFFREHGSIGLNTQYISCDYWDYLDGKPGARGKFHGDYMAQYSWAEYTLGNLTSS